MLLAPANLEFSSSLSALAPFLNLQVVAYVYLFVLHFAPSL